MKLYTEEQVQTVMLLALVRYEIHSNRKVLKENQDLIDSLTPIELPSDDEIWNEGKLVFDEKGKNIYTHYNTVPCWTEGAKWMRDKIQGGKK